MHRQKCYCGHSSSSGHGARVGILKQMCHSRQQSTTGSDRTTLTSSGPGKQAATQFVKCSRSGHNSATRGLGHSDSQLANSNFSRRNSATSSCSSCGATQQRQQQESRVKVLSWGSEQMPGSSGSESSSCSYTDTRRLYEQSACARLATEGQGQQYAQTTSSATSTSTSTSACSPTLLHPDELQRLLTLQQFRLKNATLCFSAERQHALRLQQGYDKLEASASAEKQQKNQINASRQQQDTKPTSNMPYALRQKLLQLRLKLEQAESAGSRYSLPPVDSSCALRYNCQ